MLKEFSQYQVYVEITGFRGVEFSIAEEYLKVNRKEAGLGVDVQFFDAELIASSEHLYFAVLNALEAFKNKTAISNSLAMETILYASAQRQIQKAINLLGIKPKTAEIAVAIIGKDPKQIKTVLNHISRQLCAQPDDSVLDLSEDKIPKIKQAYGITNLMINAVAVSRTLQQAIVDLIIERMALLATQL
jgi:KEOPS complex subunit Cgi121